MAIHKQYVQMTHVYFQLYTRRDTPMNEEVQKLFKDEPELGE